MRSRACKGRKILAVTAAFATMFTMTAAPVLAAEEITKEETVYVSTDSAGQANEIIVSDHLKNGLKADTISDRSDLSDIENVKGDETFEQGDDFALTWKADGNDIFYQGTSQEELPVTMDITYKLDGDTVTGKELEGQSGRLVIRIKYENNESVTVNGKETPVPFIAMTGFLVEGDALTDIDVDNGKVIDDGDKKIVLGMAAPGLKEALDLDSKEITEDLDLDLNDTVTITANAKDYDVQDMMTVVTNSLMEDLDADDIDDLDFDDEIKDLDKGAKALADGADALYDGLTQVDDSMPDLTDGADQLNSGAAELNSGTQKALAGAKELNSGSIQLRGTLKSKMKQIATASKQMETGSKTILSGMKQMKTGLDKGDGTPKNPGAINALDQVSKGLTAGAQTSAAQLQAGVDGLSQVSTGLNTVKTGLDNGTQDMSEPLKQAKAGANAASEGLEQLNSSVDTDGIQKLLEAYGVPAEDQQAVLGAINGYKGVAEGAVQAADGAVQIADGAKSGMEKASGGVGQANDGVSQVSGGLGQAVAQMRSTDPGSLNYAAGVVAQVAGGLRTMSASLGAYDPSLAKQGKSQTTLIGGMTVLNNGLGQLNSQVEQSISKKGILSQALDRLVGGTGTLKSGEEQLASGTKDLKKGTKKLKEGTEKLADGVSQLSDGSGKLADGADELYRKGIRKIVDLYNDDLKGSIDDLKDTIDAGKEYQTYTQLADGMEGSVKFIYKTSVY